MKRLILTAISGLILTQQAFGHDFWLDAKTYKMEKPGIADIGILVGHPGDHHHWSMSPHRIVSFRSINADGVVDHQSRIDYAKPDKRYLVPFEKPGVHLLAIETTSAVSVLDSKKFADYLAEEGLLPIAAHRRLRGTDEEKGREIYSRRAKALIQVGEGDSASSSFVQNPIGMTLELTPVQNPYALEPNEPMSVEVRYRGKKLAGVAVKVFRLDGEHGRVATYQSAEDGTITMKRPETGSWMLHAVWSDPLEGDSRAEYDTVFSSLSFGF